MPAFSGVRNGPGASALTVIPVPASSTARLRVSWTTAPLAGAYPDRAAPPARPSALALVRMRPYPAARRRGSRAAGQPGTRHADLQAGPQRGDAELAQGTAGLDPGQSQQLKSPAKKSRWFIDG
jgi:hypothetical protein